MLIYQQGQNPVSNVGALIDAQIDLNCDLAADLIRKLNEV